LCKRSYNSPFTGFSAARIESRLQATQPPSTVIHTGLWGCGAYGGNRILMALLQLLAARLSQVNCLIFHTGGSSGSQALAAAGEILDRYLSSDNLAVRVSDLIGEIDAMRFQWGVGDGN
jgi:hypothetical protein